MNKRKILTRPLVVLALALVCALLWGSAFPWVKIGISMLGIEHSTGGKLYFAAYRFFLAAAFIFLGIRLTGKSLGLPGVRDYAVLFLVGVLQTTLQYTFFYIGISNTTGMKASIIIGSGSFFLAVLSHFFIQGDHLSLRKNAGLVFGFLGLVLVNMNKDQLNFEFRLTGEGFIILTALSSTLALLIVKKKSSRIHPPLISAYQLLFGSVLLFFIALIIETPGVITFTRSSFLLILYLSFVSAAAFSLWYVLIKYNKLTSIAVYRFLIPVCGTFLSAAFLLEETLSVYSLTALAMVSVGMILTVRS